MKNNRIKIIIIGILSVVSLLFVIQNNENNLELFKNTSLNDNKKIDKLLHLLNYGKNEFVFDIKDGSLNIDYSVEIFNYKTLEKNASILFYLIDGLNTINYQINDANYTFTYDKISLIYDGYNDGDINLINDRYKNEKFSNLYLGNINGKIDLFDTSDLCLDNFLELETTDEYIYYITCSSIDSIIVVMDDIEYDLLSALENNLIQIDDLFEINLKISRRSVKDENIS